MQVTRPTTYKLSPDVYEYTKNNHLCFRYGDKYEPDHRCKRKQLNYLIGELGPNQVVEEATIEGLDVTSEIIIKGEIEQEIQEVCPTAHSGNHKGVNTILVKGIVKNKHLAILVDSGSTHNFIDENSLKATSYTVSYCPPVRVIVAWQLCHVHFTLPRVFLEDAEPTLL